MTYEIYDADIGNFSKRNKNNYPFGCLDVGQAFDVPIADISEGKSKRPQAAVSACAINFARRDGTGKKFRTKFDGDVIRVCRVA